MGARRPDPDACRSRCDARSRVVRGAAAAPEALWAPARPIPSRAVRPAGGTCSAAPPSSCFMLQIVTGICLALVYVPSPSGAYASLEHLNYQQTLGWFLRALHFWGSNFMVAMMSVHMIQVFLFGAYKYPRELTWIVGVFLLLCTLGMAFTGQVLRWDQDAYWGLGIGVAMIGRVPLIGAALVHLVLGGAIIGAETLTRFFALHVFVIPGPALRPGGDPPAPRAQGRHQRVADARSAGRTGRPIGSATRRRSNGTVSRSSRWPPRRISSSVASSSWPSSSALPCSGPTDPTGRRIPP